MSYHIDGHTITVDGPRTIGPCSADRYSGGDTLVADDIRKQICRCAEPGEPCHIHYWTVIYADDRTTVCAGARFGSAQAASKRAAKLAD